MSQDLQVGTLCILEKFPPLFVSYVTEYSLVCTFFFFFCPLQEYHNSSTSHVQMLSLFLRSRDSNQVALYISSPFVALVDGA